ncbi:MAG: homoserine dehydrogenase [Rhizobiaceae bacterium]|nr:homoserine dehydrogenase [Rhizobiaceae bacterium]
MNKPLRIGIAGLGTVGSALINLIDRKQELLRQRCGRPLEVTGISARDKNKARDFEMGAMQWIDNPVELAKSDNIDCFIELIGGDEGVAKDCVVAALNAGKHVVTANKALLAKHGVELAALAEKAGVLLNYEAAVAGGIPIIKVMRESLSANSVERVYGILNGTCNYILTRMEDEGLSFEECLADAQRLGYAEADPTFDVEGYDTAHKLAILCSLAFGTQIAADEIYVEGISSITYDDIKAAGEMGYRIKLLGVAQMTDSGVEQRVHPTMVPINSSIAQISGVTNAVAIDADIVGQLIMSGPGAGGDATASAVAGDIADIAKSRPGHQHGPALGTPSEILQSYKKARMRAHEGGYFIRLTVVDKAGVFASVATRMAEQNISLESIVQHRGGKNDNNSPDTSTAQPIIMITHETTEQAIRLALENIETDGHLIGKPQMIRIEK